MTELFKWLKPYDTEQLRWASDYLFRKNVSYTPNPFDHYHYLIDLDKKSGHDPAYILAVRSMKAAWRQKKLRQKRSGKTEFSLTISTEKKRKLNSLSKKKGKTQGETLEELIDDESQRNENLKKEIKNQKDLFAQKFEYRKGAHQIEIAKLEMYTNVLLCILEENIKKMIRYEIDAIKSSRPTDYEYMDTNDYYNQRLSKESESINNALKKVPSFDFSKLQFPLDSVTKFNIQSIISKVNTFNRI